jgi:hypothetical protein
LDGIPAGLSYCLPLLIGCDSVEADHGGRLSTMGGVGPLVAAKGDPAADTRCGQVLDPDGTSFELVAYDTREFMEDDRRNPDLTLTTDERLAELLQFSRRPLLAPTHYR